MDIDFTAEQKEVFREGVEAGVAGETAPGILLPEEAEAFHRGIITGLEKAAG